MGAFLTPGSTAAAPSGSTHSAPAPAGRHRLSGFGALSRDFPDLSFPLPDKADWASTFPHCGGLMQSPINIDTAATRFSPQLTSLLLSGYDLPQGETLCLRNNGHTIVLELPESMTVTGGGFPQAYRAAQLHLHWGSEHSRAGSEHTVDGHRYAGEIHVVHYSSRFASIKEAQGEPGGLAVLAAFLEVGPEENKPYQHILNHLEAVQDKGEETSIATFDVATLLPSSLDRYFRYNGSLTTPPCYQTVNWTVFNQTIRLSQEQIALLDDSLEGDEDQPLQSNFRLTQGLHGRHVLASFEIPHPGEGATPAGTGSPVKEEANK
ncbi:Carbonic anhydrase 9 [Varanus komodoensis]|nr:Carbonic anhydrase 9 [Varanus komodoensis]